MKLCVLKKTISCQLRVFPLDELVETLDDVKRLALLGDAGFLYQRVTGRTLEPFSIQREYAL